MTHPPAGKWRIVAMELWDQEFIDLRGPGSIAFDAPGRPWPISEQTWRMISRTRKRTSPRSTLNRYVGARTRWWR